jgi:hypothetical protein
VFGAIILVIAFLRYGTEYKNKIIMFYLVFGGIYVMLIAAFLAMSSTLSYEFTYSSFLFQENLMLYLLAILGWVLISRRNGLAAIAPFALILPMLFYYTANIRIPFVDMFQFTLPFFIAFYIACIYQRLRRRIRPIFLIFIILLAGFCFFQLINIQLSLEPDLTNEQFMALLGLRQPFIPNSTTILAIEERYGPWIVLVAKNSKIINPFNPSYNSTSIKPIKNFQIFLIKTKDNSFTLQQLHPHKF